MSIDASIGRFDWSRIQTYLGYAEMLPGALRALSVAPNDKEAAQIGTWIERVLLSVAGPCEGCAPTATVLVAALSEMTAPGHSVALELLSQISAAEITGPTHEKIGAVDVKEIRQAVAAGFQHYLTVLRTESSPGTDLYSCIDLMDILAFHDRSLAAEAIATLKAIRTAGRATDLATLIDNTLDDLTTSSNELA